MRRLLSLLGVLGLTMTTTTTVIACGSKSASEVIKTDLNDLHLKTKLSTIVTNQQAAFDLFIELNPEVSDLRVSVEPTGFTPPNYANEGILSVSALPTSNYQGTLSIIIPLLIRTDIGKLITNRTIDGVEDMTAKGAFQTILDANSSSNNLNTYLTYDSATFVKPSFIRNGSLTVAAKPNTEYQGSVLIIIKAIGQTKLADLPDLITGVASTTTKDRALQNFLDFNSEKYPDLEGNVILDDTSFKASDYEKAGSYTINAITDGKYLGSVDVTIPMKVKVKLENVIKNTQILGNVEENEVIAKIIAANPESGLVASDLLVTDFVAPQVATPGAATINAVESSGFIGKVPIKIVLVEQDAELKDIIDEINHTPSKTLAAIEVWKKYFAYYSQEKIQYLVNLLNNKYLVWTTENDDLRRSSLTKQVKDNVSNLLDRVIVSKDGLGDNRYDDFNIGDTEVIDLDSAHNTFTIKISLNFIWFSENDISSETTLTETRTIAIKFVAENPH